MATKITIKSSRNDAQNPPFDSTLKSTMSTFEKIPVSVCAVRLISSLQADFKAELKLDDSIFSLGVFTADSDDVAYIAADEATKLRQLVLRRCQTRAVEHGGRSDPDAGRALPR